MYLGNSPRNTKSSPSFKGNGMTLAAAELEALAAAKVSASPRVYPVRMTTGRCRLRGMESGGAVGDFGYYVGFAPLESVPFDIAVPVQSFGPNAQHVNIFGPAMVRFEVFRYRGNLVHTQVSLHAVLANQSKGGDVVVKPRILFEGRSGEVGPSRVPKFISYAGELNPLPDYLLPAWKATYEGSRCSNCEAPKKHSGHLFKIEPIVLPAGVLDSLRNAGTGIGETEDEEDRISA